MLGVHKPLQADGRYTTAADRQPRGTDQVRRRLITSLLVAGAGLAMLVFVLSFFATHNIYGLENDSHATLSNVVLHSTDGQECALGDIAPGDTVWIKPTWWKEVDLYVSFNARGEPIETERVGISPALPAETWELRIDHTFRLSRGGHATWWQWRRLLHITVLQADRAERQIRSTDTGQ